MPLASMIVSPPNTIEVLLVHPSPSYSNVVTPSSVTSSQHSGIGLIVGVMVGVLVGVRVCVEVLVGVRLLVGVLV